MRVFELRFLLALILVLLGATVIVGLNLGDDDDAMALHGQPQRLLADPTEKTLTSVGLTSSTPRPSRADSEIAVRSGASTIDLVRVLRC